MRLKEGWISTNYECVFFPLKGFSVHTLNIYNIETFEYVFRLLEYNFDNLSNLLLKLFETPLTDRKSFCESFEEIRSEICSLWKISEFQERNFVNEKRTKTLNDGSIAENLQKCTYIYVIEEYSIYSVLQNVHHDMPNGAPEQEEINKARNCFIEFSLTLHAYIWSSEGNVEDFRKDNCTFYWQVNEMALRYCESFVYSSEQYSLYKKPPYRLLRIHREIAHVLRVEIVNHEVNRLMKKAWGRRRERRYIFAECADSEWREEWYHDYTVPEQGICDYYSKGAAYKIKEMYQQYLFQKYEKAEPVEHRRDIEKWEKCIIEISNKVSKEEKYIPENEEDEFYSYILSSKKLEPIGLDKLDNVEINEDFYPRLALSNQKDGEIHYIVDHLEDIFALCFYYVLKSNEYVYRCPNCHKVFHNGKKTDYCNKKCADAYNQKMHKLLEGFDEYEKVRKCLVAKIKRESNRPQSKRQMEISQKEIKEIEDVLKSMKNEYARAKCGELFPDEFMNYLKEVKSKIADIDISD